MVSAHSVNMFSASCCVSQAPVHDAKDIMTNCSQSLFSRGAGYVNRRLSSESSERSDVVCKSEIITVSTSQACCGDKIG